MAAAVAEFDVLQARHRLCGNAPLRAAQHLLLAGLIALANLLVGFARAEDLLPPQTLQVPAQSRALGTETEHSVSGNPPTLPERPASYERLAASPMGVAPPWNRALEPGPEQAADQPASVAENRVNGHSPQKNVGGSLAVRRPSNAKQANAERPSGSGLGSLIASLCLVLGLFFLAVWLLKKGLPKGARVLPGEVVELLGRSPLGPRHHVHLLRVGNKMLLVSLSGGLAETLTEITDPVEVDRLAGLCQQQLPHSSTNAFKQIFQQFARRGEADPAEEPIITAASLSGREVRNG